MRSRDLGLNRSITRRAVLGGASALGLSALGARAHAQDAASPTASPAASDPNAPWTFTDDRGITVTLPKRPERVVVQISGAATLWDYGIRPVGVFGPQRKEDGSVDPLAGDVDLDNVVNLGSAFGEFDVEKLFDLDADLVISQMFGLEFGLWWLPEEAATAIDGSIPTIGLFVQDAPITQPLSRFAELAGLLGADLTAPAIVDAKAAFETASADLAAALAEKPDLTVAAIGGYEEALYIADPKVSSDLNYFLELGMNLVQPDADGFWEELSWEEANKYPVDLFLNDTRSQSLQIPSLLEIPTFAALPAVQANQIAPWHFEAKYTYARYAEIQTELAAIIRATDPGVA